MMKSKFTWSVALVALGFFVGAALAYADDPTCQGKKPETAAAQQDQPKGCCPQSGDKAAEKSCTGCGDKSAEKPSDCKGATAGTCGGKASDKGCGGSCGDKPGGCKGAQLTADTPSGNSCGGTCGGSCGGAAGGSPSGGCGGSCGGAAHAAKTDSGCPLAKKAEAVLTSMPAMKYRVGSEVTNCPKSAAAIAEKTGKPLEYLVGEQVVADESEAAVRLATMLESEAQKLQTIQLVVDNATFGCPVKAQTAAEKANSTVVYRVGGVDFQKQEDAEKAVEAIKGALANVKMTYKVGDETYDCPKTAKSKCDGNGKQVTYVVGDDETSSEQTAILKLAQAKIRTIVQTATQLASSQLAGA